MCSKTNRTKFAKNLLGAMTASMILSSVVCASQLPGKSLLSITQGSNGFSQPALGTGSWFAMEALGPGGWVYTGIGGNQGLQLGGAAQFSRAPNVAPNLTEVSSVDNSWSFFGSLGLHGHNGITISNNATAGAAELDFTGWYVSWNNAANISMGGDPGNFPVDTGIASITCAVDCAAGDTYILDYAGHVPLSSADFPGVSYQLHLEGTISDPNLAPVAASDPLAASTTPLGNVSINLAGNVSDPDGDGVDTISFVIASYAGTRSPAPTIVDDGTGNITYTDNDGTDTAAGVPDSFTYTVADTFGKVSASFTVEVAVVTGNLPPNAQGFSVTTNKDQLINVDVAAHATDSDGTVDPATVSVSTPVNGTLGTPNAVTGIVSFTPTSGFTGSASFDYAVKDNAGAISNTATVAIKVNNPPFAGDSTVSVDRNSFVTVDVVALSTDSDGTLNPASVTATSDVNGAISIDVGTGSVTYTPTFGAIYTGSASFTYTINDNDNATSNTGTITVNIANALPVAVDDIATIDTSSLVSVPVDVTANDTDSDGNIDKTTVNITVAPSNGTAVADATTGVISYTPNVGYVGSDTLKYSVQDNDTGLSNEATVAISISSGSDFCQKAPLAPDSCFLVFNSGKVSGDVSPVAVGNGSWFSMEVQPGVPLVVPIAPLVGLQLNISQLASTVPLVANLDQAWPFFGNTGVHQTTSAIVVASDDGAGNVTLDFSGWDVSWNGIPSIPLANGADNGVATMTCYSDDLVSMTPGTCAAGDMFTLDYRAIVPPGDPSGFGNVSYILHMEGTIKPTGAIYSPGAVPNTNDIEAIDANGNRGIVVLQAGGAAAAAGKVTGTGLTASETGLKDPKLNPADGEQCVGGCVDFVVTNLPAGTDYVDIVYRLNTPMVEGATYRKLINGVWQNFSTSGQDQLGSNGAGSSTCNDDQFPPGLRAGALCVFMRIYDGGANDADGVKNGTVVDPSGALLAGSPNVPAGTTSGCSIANHPVSILDRADWLLVAAFLAVLGLVNSKRRKNNS